MEEKAIIDEKAIIETKARLLEAVKRGGPYDDDFWADLWKSYGRRLLRLAYRKVRNEQDAKDVVQNTIVSIMNTLTKNPRPSWHSLEGILVNTLNFRLLDFFDRPNVKNASLTDSLDDPSFTPPVRSQRDASHQQSLEETLVGVDGLHRMILELFYVDGMTAKEIAETLGLKVGIVNRRKLLAKKFLAHYLRVDMKSEKESL